MQRLGLELNDSCFPSRALAEMLWFQEEPRGAVLALRECLELQLYLA